VIDLLPTSAVERLKSSLSEKRYEHSVRVLETAFHLLKAWDRHPVDETSLAWAGLFHDCAKELPAPEQNRLLESYPLKYGAELLSTPSLIHAPLGTLLLPEKYHIDFPDVLQAVAYHSTGHPTLRPVGMIVYMADYLEPGRYNHDERKKLLDSALEDPLKGLRDVTNYRIEYLKESNKAINDTVIEFQNYLNSVEEIKF